MAAIQGKWYAAANEHEAYPADPTAVRFVYADQPDGERYIVAKVWADGADYESNARLVAAAPALLERLKAMCSGLECACDKADPEHPLCDVCWSRQVIDAAEGVG